MSAPSKGPAPEGCEACRGAKGMVRISGEGGRKGGIPSVFSAMGKGQGLFGRGARGFGRVRGQPAKHSQWLWGRAVGLSGVYGVWDGALSGKLPVILRVIHILILFYA
jgi:hypothetical protein